jgi:hypothetical protein
MNEIVWTQELADELRTLRLKYSIEQTVLAKETAISLKQLIQLEEGGCSAFYSEQIKYQVGKKLIALLTVDSAASTDKNGIADHDINKNNDELRKLEKLQYKKLTSNFDTQNSVIDEFWDHYKLPSLLFIALSLLISFRYAYDSIKNSSLSTESYQLQIDSNKNSTFATPVSAPANNRIEILNVVDKPMSEEAEAPKPSELKKCEIKLPELTLRPNTAIKPSNYVYIQASNDASVCVLDGDKKTHTLLLGKDTSNSVYGQPPWQISSYQMNSLKIFFQGNHIFVPGQNTSQILIQEIN